MKKRLLVGLLIVALACTVLAGCGNNNASQQRKSDSVQFEPGKPLGDFETVDIDGNPVNQDILKEADLTFVQVWGTYCGPCQAELPAMAALAKHYPANNIKFVGIILDAARQDGSPKEEQIAEARRLLENAQVSYLQLLPNGTMMGNTQLKAVKALPTTFFVDKEGNVLKNPYIGAKTLEDWKAIIDGVLKDQGLPVPAGELVLPEETQTDPAPAEEGTTPEEAPGEPPVQEDNQPEESQ